MCVFVKFSWLGIRSFSKRIGELYCIYIMYVFLFLFKPRCIGVDNGIWRILIYQYNMKKFFISRNILIG